MNRRIIVNWAILIILLVLAGYLFVKSAPVFVQPETPYALLYYYQPGCPACDKIEPTIDALEVEYAGCITVRRLNVQWRRAPNVQGTPTVLLVDREGKELARWVGAQPIGTFSAALQPLCRTK